MPTMRPRYQITDTGRTERMLDRAAAAWPEMAEDRKGLLLRALERGTTDLEPANTNLEEELRQHVGQWVVIKHGRVWMASDDPQEIVDSLKTNNVRGDHMFIVPENFDVFSEFGEHGGIG